MRAALPVRNFLGAAPAGAQSAAARVQGAEPAAREGWCIAEGLAWGARGSDGPRWRAEAPGLRGAELDRLAEGAIPPARALAVRGPRAAGKVPDPVPSWVLEVQSRRGGIGLDLALTRDAAAGRPNLSRAAADLPGGNAVTLPAEIGGAAPRAEDTAPAALHQTALTLAVETNGLFEAPALLPPGAALFPPDADPEEPMAGAKAALTAAPDALPADFEPGAREAPTAAAEALPAPSGTLTLTLSAPDSPLPPALRNQRVPGGAPDWPAILAGVCIGATSDPAAE